MKLRNKKTGLLGELKDFMNDGFIVKVTDGFGTAGYKFDSLAELNEEWEDYEEPKEYWFISTTGEVHRFEGEDKTYTPGRKQLGNQFSSREEAEKAVERLRAWKRLKDKNFHFLKYSALGCGEIEFSLDFEDMEDEGEIGELRRDLDLLFGGEE